MIAALLGLLKLHCCYVSAALLVVPTVGISIDLPKKICKYYQEHPREFLARAAQVESPLKCIIKVAMQTSSAPCAVAPGNQ